jgi:hypothetical protein
MVHVAHTVEMRVVYSILDRKILIGRLLPNRDSAPCSAKCLMLEMLRQLVLSFAFRHWS